MLVHTPFESQSMLLICDKLLVVCATLACTDNLQYGTGVQRLAKTCREQDAPRMQTLLHMPMLASAVHKASRSYACML